MFIHSPKKQFLIFIIDSITFKGNNFNVLIVLIIHYKNINWKAKIIGMNRDKYTS